MRSAQLWASVLLLTSTCTASNAGWDAIEALKQGIVPIERRQDETTSKFDLSFTGKQGDTATTESTESTAKETGTSDSEATTTKDSDDATSTNDSKSSGTKKTTGTAKATGTAKTSKSGSATKTFDARLPAGGISMITPNAQSTSYYKIRDHITFAWNYTSVSVTPSAVDVLASCSLNQETYTIAMNLTVEETNSIVWDTGKFQASATVPLLTETYTLIIHDAAKDVSASPQAGYLDTYKQFTFGMYSPQPYTPIADYVCATCNSAMSSMERQTLWALFGMVGLTVLSFGWFAGVAGLW